MRPENTVTNFMWIPFGGIASISVVARSKSSPRPATRRTPSPLGGAASRQDLALQFRDPSRSLRCLDSSLDRTGIFALEDLSEKWVNFAVMPRRAKQDSQSGAISEVDRVVPRRARQSSRTDARTGIIWCIFAEVHLTTPVSLRVSARARVHVTEPAQNLSAT